MNILGKMGSATLLRAFLLSFVVFNSASALGIKPKCKDWLKQGILNGENSMDTPELVQAFNNALGTELPKNHSPLADINEDGTVNLD